MTEFELVSALQTQLSMSWTLESNFATAGTAYLTAGYLAGHRLPLSMALFMTIVFVVMSGLFLIGLDANYRIVQDLGQEIRNYAQAGKGFMWVTALKSEPTLPPIVRHTIIQVIEGLAVIASVYFFFRFRKENLGAQVQTPPAKT